MVTKSLLLSWPMKGGLSGSLKFVIYHRLAVFPSSALTSKLASPGVEVNPKGPSTTDSNSLKLNVSVQEINLSSIFQHNRMQENALRAQSLNCSVCLILLCIGTGLHFRLGDKLSFFNSSILFSLREDLISSTAQ